MCVMTPFGGAHKATLTRTAPPPRSSCHRAPPRDLNRDRVEYMARIKTRALDALDCWMFDRWRAEILFISIIYIYIPSQPWCLINVLYVNAFFRLISWDLCVLCAFLMLYTLLLWRYVDFNINVPKKKRVKLQIKLKTRSGSYCKLHVQQFTRANSARRAQLCVAHCVSDAWELFCAAIVLTDGFVLTNLIGRRSLKRYSESICSTTWIYYMTAIFQQVVINRQSSNEITTPLRYVRWVVT